MFCIRIREFLLSFSLVAGIILGAALCPANAKTSVYFPTPQGFQSKEGPGFTRIDSNFSRQEVRLSSEGCPNKNAVEKVLAQETMMELGHKLEKYFGEFGKNLLANGKVGLRLLNFKLFGFPGHYKGYTFFKGPEAIIQIDCSAFMERPDRLVFHELAHAALHLSGNKLGPFLQESLVMAMEWDYMNRPEIEFTQKHFTSQKISLEAADPHMLTQDEYVLSFLLARYIVERFGGEELLNALVGPHCNGLTGDEAIVNCALVQLIEKRSPGMIPPEKIANYRGLLTHFTLGWILQSKDDRALGLLQVSGASGLIPYPVSGLPSTTISIELSPRAFSYLDLGDQAIQVRAKLLGHSLPSDLEFFFLSREKAKTRIYSLRDLPEGTKSARLIAINFGPQARSLPLK